MTHSELLWDRFVLRTSAYAFQAGGDWYTARNGKEDLPLTPQVIKDHCAGKLCVGLYQLDVDKVKWIGIDIDGAEGNSEGSREAVKALVWKCRHFGIEPAVEWSGKKGWHLWIFTDVISASIARAVGQGIIAETGEDGRDGCQEVVCFPKQVSTESYGNLLKLPWGTRADNGNRGLFVDPTTLASTPVASEQLALAQAAPTYSEAFLKELVDENGWESFINFAPPPREGYDPLDVSEEYPHLPCFKHLIDPTLDLNIPSGARNNVLFALAGQEFRRTKRKDKRNVFLSILNINSERCRPPMAHQEVDRIVNSAASMRSSVVGCKALQDAKLCPVLSMGLLCPVFKIEREKREQETASLESIPNRFSIAPLRKLCTEPPIYTATVNGHDIVVDSDQLFNWKLFQKRVMEVIDWKPPLPKIPVEENGRRRILSPEETWIIITNEALEGVIKEPPPPADASAAGIAWEGVLDFIGVRTLSENKDDLDKGHIYTDGDFVYFRGPKLLAHMKLSGTDTIPTNRLWKMIQGKGGRNTTIRTGKGTVRVWCIPSASVSECSNEPEEAVTSYAGSSLGL